MKKLISITTLNIFFAVLFIFPMSAVFARPQMEISGTFEASIIPVPVKFAGDNIFMEMTGIGSWDGSIVANTVAYHNWHINKDGNINVHLTATMDATFMGKTGTINIIMRGRIAENGAVGNWRIISATGELEGLHGGGIYGMGWYEGKVHFDP